MNVIAFVVTLAVAFTLVCWLGEGPDPLPVYRPHLALGALLFLAGVAVGILVA
jgi:hypothetical protein